MNKLIRLLLIISFCSIGLQFGAKAQESMIPDISYLFLEKLIATAKQNYPRVKQFGLQVSSAELDVKKEKLNWLDPFNVSYVSQPNKTVNFIDPSFYSGYQFGINVNIADILQKPNNVKKTKLEFQNAKEQEKEYALTLEAEVKNRYFAYIQQLNTVKLFTKSFGDAKGLLTALQLRYERGEVNTETYLQGLTSFNNVNQQKLAAEGAFLSAKASIEELTITRIEDIK
ncbi:MAG: TolC family protein [Candidatus Dojkabacteria bacterium]